MYHLYFRIVTCKSGLRLHRNIDIPCTVLPFFLCKPNESRGKNWRHVCSSPDPHAVTLPPVGIMRVLNVAEKNDAAKTLAGFMSSNIRRREGLSKFNKIYEYECMLFGQKCDMVMTSVSGHLLSYDFVGFYKTWRTCSPLLLFDAPIVKQCINGFEDIKRTLEREAQKCAVLIIWTDCDREGENIGFEVISVCTAVKPTLKVYRAKFSEITAQSVKRALQNLSQPDKRINDAVEVRQELDLRIGAAFTRFQTLRLQQVFPQSLHDALVSYGSCQFPTLGFVVERFKAIANFQEEAFWKIKVVHEVDGLAVEFHWERVRIFDEFCCQALYEECIENPVATVLSVNSKPKNKWRPQPLDTVELEKVGSRKLGIGAKQIMQIAEKLYTQGFISYPRTETNIFPKELNLRPLIEMQTSDPAWGDFAAGILLDGPHPRNGKKTDKAHPPIHPIKYTAGLSGNDHKVYEFIVRHFLACCSKDAEGYETVVKINIGEEHFVASGLMITARNFLEVYPYQKWNAKELHVYQVGQTFRPEIDMVDGKTSPPHLLTEADLIALMEKHGIGTDATHADHIETIKSRDYVGLQDEKYFVPGLLGMGLVEGYDSMGFPMSKPDLRAELEADLVKICEGQKDPQVVIREQLAKYKQVFQIALEQAAKIDEALAKYIEERPTVLQTNPTDSIEAMVPVLKCPNCGFDMVLKTKKDGSGKFISCMGYPNCRNAVWFPLAVEQVDVSQEACEECGPSYKKLKFTFRRGTLPPSYPREDTYCIGGCDRDLLEILDIPVNRVRSAGSMQLTGTHSSGFSDRDISNALSSLSQNALRTPQDFPFPSNPSDTFGRPQGPGRGRGQGRGEGRGRGRGEGRGRGSGEGSGQGSGEGRGRGSGAGRGRGQSGGEGRGQGRGAGSKKRPYPDNSSGSANTLSSYGFSGTTNVNHGFNGTTNVNHGFNGTANVNHGFSGTTNVNQRQNMNDENHIQCKCNQNAIRLTVKKDGPNKGRPFYKCGNQGSPCNFFLWADAETESGPQPQPAVRLQAPPNNTGPGRVNQDDRVDLFDSGFDMDLDQTVSSIEQTFLQALPGPPPPPLVGTSFLSVANEDNPVECRCQKRATLLTVRKEGLNKGRQFYRCGNQQGDSCGFFLWADSASADSAAQSSSYASSSSSNNGWPQPPQRIQSQGNNSAGGSRDAIRCRCGGPAKRLTVQKEGPNKGRQFYGCPKSIDRCNFFMWADEDSSSESNEAGGHASGGYGVSGSSASTSSEPKRRRKCGNCHQEGRSTASVGENFVSGTQR